ncbi:crustacean hyperglycemic hormone-like [Penaeus japonicus]|uniref:crustacean hyperglycemic hormone-like n=1 Tax=Penaeus japonicus TaxID=27405 RepID=UPI001C710901|nr:crustacean hyperglycemic hormone-like [Penaeus japonicus]
MAVCALWMMVALAASCGVMSHGRIMESGHSRLAFDPPSTPPSSASKGAASSLRLAKREVFDSACKGVYDRSLWAKLNRACEDCQNLFRKEPGIYEACRENCFGTQIFPACVIELSLNLDQYMFESELLREF